MSPYRRTERLAARLREHGSPITSEEVAALAEAKGASATYALIKRLTHPPLSLLEPLPVRGTYKVVGADSDLWVIFRAWLLQHPGMGQVIQPSSQYLRGDDGMEWAAQHGAVVVATSYCPAVLTRANYLVRRSQRLDPHPKIVDGLPLHGWL